MTLWYRAPEILLGCKTYSPVVDLWSIGCIMWELIQKIPLFPGDSQIGELYLIFKLVLKKSITDCTFRLLGTPSESIWPGVTAASFWMDCFPKWPAKRIQHRLHSDPIVSDLLKLLLVMNPSHRLTTKEALNHPFFVE